MSIKGNNRQRTEWYKAQTFGVTHQALHSRLQRAVQKLQRAARRP
jgi:hypothetical protein